MCSVVLNGKKATYLHLSQDRRLGAILCYMKVKSTEVNPVLLEKSIASKILLTRTVERCDIIDTTK